MPKMRFWDANTLFYAKEQNMSKKIKKFEFVNLGLFKGNYNIVLSNNITVITGNNGNGKTTIISGLNAVLGNNIDSIESLISNGKNTTNLKLTFDDNTSVILKLLKEKK